MTTLLDKKQSVIGKVQDLDEATTDQCFRASPRWRRWSRGTLATLSKVGDCRRRSSCPASSRHGFMACSDPGEAVMAGAADQFG